MGYINEHKHVLIPQDRGAEGAKAQALQAQIDLTDAEIDRMVYTLYGLSEEEVVVLLDAYQAF